jgi:hypothetical protein
MNLRGEGNQWWGAREGQEQVAKNEEHEKGQPAPNGRKKAIGRVWETEMIL